MGSDTVEHLWNTNSFDLFGFSGSFDEHLLMKIVMVLSDILLSFSQ